MTGVRAFDGTEISRRTECVWGEMCAAGDADGTQQHFNPFKASTSFQK